MKKVVLMAALIGLVLAVAAVVVVTFTLDSAVKKGVETLGPQITKVEIKLAGAKIGLFSGSGEVNGLMVGNPEGFKTQRAISVGRASLALQPSSIFSDKIVIKSIIVEAPEVTFEGSLKGNNLSKILENIEAATGGGKEPPTPGGSKPAKKLQVDEFVIREGKINLSVTALGGKSATVPLPEIRLTELGTGADGITPAEVTRKVFKAILEHTTKAVAGVIGELGKEAVERVKGVGEGAKGAAEKAVKGLGDLFKKK